MRTRRKPTKRRIRLPGALIAAALSSLPATPSLAQTGDSDSVTNRLIELLVKRGVLQRDDANALLAAAKAEKKKPAKLAAKPASPEKPAAEAAVPSGTVRVTYVPQFVRDQIAQQVRDDLLQQASQPGAAPAVPPPGWLDRFHLFGDLRIRGEGEFADANVVLDSAGRAECLRDRPKPQPRIRGRDARLNGDYE